MFENNNVYFSSFWMAFEIKFLNQSEELPEWNHIPTSRGQQRPQLGFGTFNFGLSTLWTTYYDAGKVEI